jgi:hypothetical protein
MQSASIETLSLEIITEIISFLDYPDQENAYYTCRTFYHARPFVLFPAIESQSAWLRSCENCLEIPRKELISHNTFLGILNRTFTVTRPSQHVLDRLVSFFAQELISAWMVPMNIYGAEIRCNNSVADARLYHRRYPHLLRLAMLLRWNNAGPRIAVIIHKWLDMKWAKIENDEEVQLFIDPDFTSTPSNIDLRPHQSIVLRGLEYLALYPVIHYAPQDAAAEDIRSRLNDDAWTHPGFDRLKLWLSIPELWNMEIRHLEIKTFIDPWRVFRRINSRPFLHLLLFRSSEFCAFSLRLFHYIRSIELSTPHPNLIQGSRYWYEEGFCGAALYWNFHLFSFPGQYISLFKKPFVDIIRGYIYLFGPTTLSDLVRNIVFFVNRRTLPMRIIVARTIMSELLIYGYEFLSDEAKEAIVGLMRDETGRLMTRQPKVDHTQEVSAPRGDRSSMR